jgi:hypothetical protein
MFGNWYVLINTLEVGIRHDARPRRQQVSIIIDDIHPHSRFLSPILRVQNPKVQYPLHWMRKTIRIVKTTCRTECELDYLSLPEAFHVARHPVASGGIN